MKIATIIGARPQFIKSAPLSKALQKAGLEEFTIHTGQHYDPEMSDVFFTEMNLPKPWKRLDYGNLPRLEMIEAMKNALLDLLKDLEPDAVLVYGDTNSTLAGARAAHQLKIKLIHVEAGLRSGNLDMPEEHNRIETDQLSDVLFTPSDQATQTLQAEGLDKARTKISNVGDIMLDAFKTFSPFAVQPNSLESIPSSFALATLHRAENTKNPDRLQKLIDELNAVNARSLKVILPVHPSAKAKLDQLLRKPEFTLIPPVSYLEIIGLLNRCSLVLTDSGGLQKEAFYAQKPCITLRDETEWVELIDGGFNQLFRPSQDSNLVRVVDSTLDQKIDFNSSSPYGSGNSAELIVQTIQDVL